uniref:Transmembrane BAX inhibitor motif containing 1a n=1 Tax=Sinocyclocheilus rhinocerous TaxID=307959 RepID=A0A673H4C0_9TELE
MSRSDFPPSYDDSRLLSNPQPGGGYPASVPPYGFNAYAGQPPYPQPNDPYRGQPPYPQPNDPYRGQPAGYPPPNIPAIPIIPPGVGDNEGFTTTGGFDDISVRHTFIRKDKCYLCLFREPVGVFVRKNPAIYWVSYAVYLVTHIVLVCCQGPRRRFPWNLILLSIFVSWKILSHSEGIMRDCGQTCNGQCCFCILFQIPWLHMLYAAIGAIAFTLFLAYHTQLLIGNRKLSIGPEEYVFAALSLYVDIVQIFIFLLQIIGYAER